VGRVMTALEVMHKVTLDLAKGKDVERVSGDLAKMGGDLAKAIGDMTKVAAAVDTLEERLEVVWKMAAGQGPVLREIGFFGPVSLEGQEESVLKGLMDETDNPQLRQLIGARIAELQIRAVHDQYRRR